MDFKHEHMKAQLLACDLLKMLRSFFGECKNSLQKSWQVFLYNEPAFFFEELMTPVGHVLTGISIGVVSMPERKKAPWKILYFVVFSLLSLVPDFHIKYWGHDRYYISHSIFTNLLAILILILLLSRSKNVMAKLGGWQVIIGGSLAWLSHLLLDTFYNHGKGLLMFWPFSEARLALPIPWLSVVKDLPPPFTEETIRILLIELVSYGALLVFVIALKQSGALQWVVQHIFRANSHNTDG